MQESLLDVPCYSREIHQNLKVNDSSKEFNMETFNRLFLCIVVKNLFFYINVFTDTFYNSLYINKYKNITKNVNFKSYFVYLFVPYNEITQFHYNL